MVQNKGSVHETIRGRSYVVCVLDLIDVDCQYLNEILNLIYYLYLFEPYLKTIFLILEMPGDSFGLLIYELISTK